MQSAAGPEPSPLCSPRAEAETLASWEEQSSPGFRTAQRTAPQAWKLGEVRLSGPGSGGWRSPTSTGLMQGHIEPALPVVAPLPRLEITVYRGKIGHFQCENVSCWLPVTILQTRPLQL